MVNFTTVYETEASSTSKCPATFIYLSKKPLFISAFDNKSKVTRGLVSSVINVEGGHSLLLIQNTGTEKEISPNLKWLTECTYTRSNSSKEIARL